MPPLALAVVFLVLGLAILIAEVFLPSGGILAILTFASLAASIAAAYRALYENYPEYFWVFCGVVAASVPATVFFGFWLLPRTPMGRKLMLEGPTPEEVDPYAADRERLRGLIGKSGTAVTDHMPSGLVEVGGERLHSEAHGPRPSAGEAVEVVAVEGRRVVVKRVAATEDDDADGVDDGTSEAIGDDPFGEFAGGE